MPDIKFDFRGKEFTAQVPDSFLQRPKEEQQRLLLQNLKNKYDTKIPERTSDEKNVLDYIGLLERPAQALKVGLRESKLGGDVFSALGGVDLTPKEGLFQGIKSGWLGEDEVRTQDLLPDNLSPVTKGILGFAGDVVTDPLTWAGPAVVTGIGKGLKATGKATGATPLLQAAGQKAMDMKFGKSDIGIPDIARMFNVPVGKSREAKKVLDESKNIRAGLQKEMAESVGPLAQYFTARAKQLDVPEEEIKRVFANEAQRPRQTKPGTVFQPNIGIADEAYYADDGTLMPLQSVSKQAQETLGEEGLMMLDNWERMGDRLYDLSVMYGQPLNRVVKKGYFPGVLTSQGRKYIESGKDEFIEGFDEFGEPVMKAGYKKERTVLDRKTIEEANAERQEAMAAVLGSHGSRPNPADKPYEFFQSDPVVAMTMRWDRQNNALQNKWAIDEISDNPRVTGLQYQSGVMAQGGSFDDAFDWSKKGFSRQWDSTNNEWKYVEDPINGAAEDGWARRTFQTADGNTDFDAWLDFMNSQPYKQERGIGFWLRRGMDEDGIPDGTWILRKKNPELEGKFGVREPITIDGQTQYKVISNLDIGTKKYFKDGDKIKYRETTQEDVGKPLIDKTGNNVPQTRPLEQYVEEVIDPKEAGFEEVIGIPRRQVPEDILDQEWRKVFDNELQAKGIFLDMPRNKLGAGRLRLTDDTIKSLGSEYVAAAKVADKARRMAKENGSQIFMAPKQIKRQVEDVLSLMRGDIASEKQIKKFFKFYDEIQNGWKSWTLGVRPAYHTRNAVGNILNAYIISGLGVNIPEAIDTFTNAAKLQYYARFAGSDVARQKFIDDIGGAKGLFYKGTPKLKESEWTKPNFMDTGYSMKEIAEAARARGITAGHYRADNIRALEAQQEAALGQGSKLRRTIGAENPAVQAGFALGGTIEGNARFAVFIDALRKMNKGKKKLSEYEGELFKLKETVDPVTGKPLTVREVANIDDRKFEIASMEVKKSQFDYTDVSAFERDVLKRFMPFYTWTRKNIPAQLKSLVLNPQRAEKLAIAKQQFENETGDLDYSDYGAFWGDRVPVFLGQESQGIIKAFTLLNIVPMADLQRMIKPAPLIAEMVSPAIKAPLEIIANYDTFRKSKIAKQPIGTGESKDFLGVSLPPRLYHLAQVLVPLTEINRLNPAGVFGERMKDEFGRLQSTRAYGGMGALRENTIDAPEVARWVRFFSGGTVYDVDLGRNRYIMNKNLKKDIATLKGAIKWAARNGQNDRVKVLYELLDQVQRQEITDPMGERS